MIWFVIGMLVLVAGGAGTLYVVLHATTDGDDNAPFSPERDGTPTGDTAQHAGEQSSGGETTGGADADESGGTGTPHVGGGRGDGDGSDIDEPLPAGTYESGVIGGEAEGESAVQTGEPPTPND